MTGVTVATFLLAVCGPPMLAFVAAQVLDESPSVTQSLPFDLALWTILAVVLVVMVRVERQPLRSIGLRAPRRSTAMWAVALLLATSYVAIPAALWLVTALGLPGPEAGVAKLAAFPAWYRVIVGVSAGCVEEPLYRGYATERLASWTGNRWLGGALALAVFGAAHLPAWGVGPALVFTVAGAIGTIFYLWKGDLVALIVAHAVGDTIGLVWQLVG
jgi:membrane protease YdiL (CAAX protease family)